MKILFLLKRSHGYSYGGSKSGLLNSAKITAGQLSKYLGIDTKVVVCVDGNSVDREVYVYKPDICIIEALWVTPEKLKEVAKLHPKVGFYVRVHSEIPFLAMEGVALKWLKSYCGKNIAIAFNSSVTTEDFRKVVRDCFYLPNVYTHIRTHFLSFLLDRIRRKGRKKHYIDIASFGSIRPLKNQLQQAFAAIEYGNKNDKSVHFHVNGGRLEQGGEMVLKNIRALFSHHCRHRLIEHGWLNRGEFLELVSHMDIGMQTSFTESFNIVAADFVVSGVPIIVSNAIRWMPSNSKTEFDVTEMSEKIKQTLNHSHYYSENAKKYLNNYNKAALDRWECFLKS